MAFQKGYPATINPKEGISFVMELAKSVPGVTTIKECEPQMGGEDFPYYLQHGKGAFFFTGAQYPELNAIYPHHHPKFKIDEKGMLIAA